MTAAVAFGAGPTEYEPELAVLTMEGSAAHAKAASGDTLFVLATGPKWVTVGPDRSLVQTPALVDFSWPVVLQKAVGYDGSVVLSEEESGRGTLGCRDILGDIWSESKVCEFAAVSDVNGDGLSDTTDRLRQIETVFDGDNPIGSVGVVSQYLSTAMGVHSRYETALPGFAGYALPDLNGDSFGEFVATDYPWVRTDDVFWEEGFERILSSTTRIFGGSAEGYLGAPWAELAHDRVLMRPLPIQFDDDPELELLAFAGSLFDQQFEDPALVLLDLSSTPPSLTVLSDPQREVGPRFNQYDATNPYGYAFLVDDQDHDGIEDLVFVHGGARLLGSTVNYDGSQPLFDFQYQGPSGDDPRSMVSHQVHDIDGDGYLDFIGTWSGAVPSESDIVVVFGPFLEAPVLSGTADTSDTGAGDTGAPSDTGDTASTTESATVCGCSSGSPTGLAAVLVLAPLVHRRRHP